MVTLNSEFIVADQSVANHGIADADSTALCVHELFERQAARSPDAVAVVFRNRTLSYRQLNDRANHVAHYLRQRRIGPDVLVGVALPRSPELLVGLLGVWKAGAAYVPLDPSYPAERLDLMVRDAGLSLLLTNQTSCPLFSASPVKTICLDDDGSTIDQGSSANPASMAKPGNLAYVMYTSGSTGQPKGVMVTHGGLANYLHWAIGAYGFVAGRSAPVHSSISFDLTVTSLYPPLLVGGYVELLEEDIGAQNLLDFMRRGEPDTVIKLTPAHLDLLNHQLSPAEMGAMTGALVIGGENLAAESLRPWRRYAPAVRLFNEYGPTETVVGCCVHEVGNEDSGRGSVPIGRPITNTTLHILDAEMRRAPPGVSGELYIGGMGVALGYLNRPQLTEKRFIADPFSGDTGARLYKSGDRARLREDGILEFLGRTDHQVKVGGYRIELGEIEGNLADHGGVKSCVALAPEESPGHRQLVAYVVRKGAGGPSGKDLESFLKQRLPEFMVPRKYVFIDALPLTTNGKIDRQSLLDMSSDPEAVSGAATPQSGSATEEKIAAIWRGLLGLDAIALGADVFDLGARSLQAVRAVTHLRTTFAVDIQLRHIFANPSVAGQASVIDGLLWLARQRVPAASSRELEEFEL